VAVASLTAGIGWYLRRRAPHQEEFPTDWIEVGSVEQLLIYPLKSGAAIFCDDIECSDFGPKNGDSRDR